MRDDNRKFAAFAWHAALAAFLFGALPLAAEKAPYVLVWEEEFDGSGIPDPARWNFETDGNDSGWGNGEDQYYTEGRPENARLENGKLVITARKEDYRGFRYTSARITTRGKGDWKYGRIEIHAKLPDGLGIWPAFWMMPSEDYYGGWPNSGEIDIMEFFGFERANIQNNAHTGGFNHARGNGRGAKYPSGTAFSDFHVYALEWDKNRMDFYFDGKRTWSLDGKEEDIAAWPFDRRFYLILNCAVGGTWNRENGGIDDSIFPRRVEIERVRIYQRDDGTPKTLEIGQSAGGTVTKSPGDGPYRVGTRVVLTAKPEPGFRHAGWRGDFVSSDNPLTLTIGANETIRPVFIPARELVTNGDFGAGAAFWLTWADSPSVKARFIVRDGVLEARVEKTGKHEWQAQINQGIALEPETSYRITARLRADRSKKARVAIAKNYEPFSTYAERRVTLKKKAADYSFEYVTGKEGDARARIEIDFGDGVGTVFVEGVSVEKTGSGSNENGR